MKVIRRGVFETNSSSTHSITMCSKDEYDAWESGKLLFDTDACKFVSMEEQDAYKTEHKWANLQTSEEYWNDEYLEGYDDTYTTKSGDKVVAFGKYGMDN